MARDYAKTRPGTRAPAAKKSPRQRQEGSSRTSPGARPGSGWRFYFAGLLSGIFLSFLLYLGTLPATDSPAPGPAANAAATVPAEPPKPHFDFYTMLPQQTLDGPVEPAEVATPPPGSGPEGTELTEDEKHLAKLGYKQDLHRSWSGFSNFAISFSIISISDFVSETPTLKSPSVAMRMRLTPPSMKLSRAML